MSSRRKTEVLSDAELIRRGRRLSALAMILAVVGVLLALLGSLAGPPPTPSAPVTSAPRLPTGNLPADSGPPTPLAPPPPPPGAAETPEQPAPP
ncbi:MAG TPA: hypothetical protein VNO81_07260, partial [Candidatus Nitrosotenuis sp.]|nr:hypothetical protein [Candidatus Nitrosotenuis sp.]